MYVINTLIVVDFVWKWWNVSGIKSNKMNDDIDKIKGVQNDGSCCVSVCVGVGEFCKTMCLKFICM